VSVCEAFVVRYVIAVLLFAALAPSASTAKPAQPSYVVQAEKNYRQARRAVEAAENDVERLNRKATRETRRAMAKYGQWIEPAGLWQKHRAANQNLSFLRQQERQAFKELNRARDAARRSRVGTVQQPEPLSTPFWWW
jgi:tRNA uridine 5-carbamoylmethylation protein Kti12